MRTKYFSCSHGLSGTALFSYERFFTGLTSMNPTYLTQYLRKMGYVKFEVGTVHSPGWNHEVMN